MKDLANKKLIESGMRDVDLGIGYKWYANFVKNYPKVGKIVERKTNKLVKDDRLQCVNEK